MNEVAILEERLQAALKAAEAAEERADLLRAIHAADSVEIASLRETLALRDAAQNRNARGLDVPALRKALATLIDFAQNFGAAEEVGLRLAADLCGSLVTDQADGGSALLKLCKAFGGSDNA